MTTEQLCAAMGAFAAKVAISYEQPHGDLTAGSLAAVAMAEACGGDYPQRFKEAIRPLVAEMREILVAQKEEAKRNGTEATPGQG